MQQMVQKNLLHLHAVTKPDSLSHKSKAYKSLASHRAIKKAVKRPIKGNVGEMAAKG